MSTFTAYADAELVTLAFLKAKFPSGVRFATETPADLGTQGPVAQVSRIGGSAGELTSDSANIDIDYFDVAHDGKSAYANASAGAAQIRVALLVHSQGFTGAGGAIQSVREISAPRWVPYDNTSLRRFVATYRITIHSIPS